MFPVSAADIIQGAVLASILAGFAFTSATSDREKDPSLAQRYFLAGMLMLLSVWSGLLYYVAADTQPERQSLMGIVCFALLVLGAAVFVVATTLHVNAVHGGGAKTVCSNIGVGVIIVSFLLLVYVVKL